MAEPLAFYRHIVSRLLRGVIVSFVKMKTVVHISFSHNSTVGRASF